MTCHLCKSKTGIQSVELLPQAVNFVLKKKELQGTSVCSQCLRDRGESAAFSKRKGQNEFFSMTLHTNVWNLQKTTSPKTFDNIQQLKNLPLDECILYIDYSAKYVHEVAESVQADQYYKNKSSILVIMIGTRYMKMKHRRSTSESELKYTTHYYISDSLTQDFVAVSRCLTDVLQTLSFCKIHIFSDGANHFKTRKAISWLAEQRQRIVWNFFPTGHGIGVWDSEGPAFVVASSKKRPQPPYSEPKFLVNHPFRMHGRCMNLPKLCLPEVRTSPKELPITVLISHHPQLYARLTSLLRGCGKAFSASGRVVVLTKFCFEIFRVIVCFVWMVKKKSAALQLQVFIWMYRLLSQYLLWKRKKTLMAVQI